MFSLSTRSRLTLLKGLILLPGLVVCANSWLRGADGSLPSLTTLSPGAIRVIEHPLTINVVFVGYQPGSGPRQIDVNRFRSGLPQQSKPVVRGPNLYYGIYRELGLHFPYAYNT